MDSSTRLMRALRISGVSAVPLGGLLAHPGPPLRTAMRATVPALRGIGDRSIVQPWASVRRPRPEAASTERRSSSCWPSAYRSLPCCPGVDRALLTPAVLVAAFGLVCSLHAGWRRTLALVPALVLGTVVGAATAGTPAWPWLVAALGMLVGLAARVGWAVPAVVAAFITVGVPPRPDGATWTRPAVVAVVGLYAVVVAGVLKLPATVPGRRLPWPVSLVVAVVCAAAAGLAGVLAQASGNPFGSWAPATLVLLAQTRRAACRAGAQR